MNTWQGEERDWKGLVHITVFLESLKSVEQINREGKGFSVVVLAELLFPKETQSSLVSYCWLNDGNLLSLKTHEYNLPSEMTSHQHLDRCLTKLLGPLAEPSRHVMLTTWTSSYNGVVKSVTEVRSDLDRAGFLRIFYLEISGGQITELARESEDSALTKVQLQQAWVCWTPAWLGFCIVGTLQGRPLMTWFRVRSRF